MCVSIYYNAHTQLKRKKMNCFYSFVSQVFDNFNMFYNYL